MPAPSSSRRATCFVAILAALFTVSAASSDPVPGTLVGKELSAASEVQSGFESIAGSLLAGDLKGEVTKVVVTVDEPQRLVVQVSYEGFSDAKLWGEVVGQSRKRLAGLAPTEPVTLSDGAGQVELEFQWKPDAPGAPAPRTRLLRINAARTSRLTPSYRRSFELVKEWGLSGMSGADFRATVTPQPVGRTAELGPTPTSVVPSSSVHMPPPPPNTTPAPAPTTSSAPTTTTMTRRMVMSAPAPSGTRAITPTSTARVMMAPAPGQAAAAALPHFTGIVPIKAFTFGLPPAETSNSPRGPAAIPLRPFVDVRTEDIDLDLTRVLNLFPEIYQDQNPISGIFYFLPHSYALKWDPMEGYELRSIYSAAGAPTAAGTAAASAATGTTAGQVMMAARLDAGLGPRDIEIAAKIVEAYANAHGLTFHELRALPIDDISISISDDLGRYSIPADRVAVHGLSDVMGQIDVSWVTDERTKDFIQEALVQNVGINGTVTYKASGGALGPRLVPIRMLLGDYSTFGPIRWDRTGWKNPTPYPITLRYLHALRLVPGSPPVVLSWSLADTKVPPGGLVRWSSAGVPVWVDAKAEKMWVDYAVDRTCMTCGSQALSGLTGGVSTTGSAQITFHTMTPLADAGAYEIQVDVRSRYFDPSARETQVRTLVLNADERDFTLGPLFPGSHADGHVTPGDPLFEYRLGLRMKDGTPVRGNAAWLPSDELRVLVGRHQLEESLGTLPQH